MDNGGEIVVEQNHGGRLFGYVRSGDTHGDADVGSFQCRRVIDPVARHGDYFAHFLERRDDAHFVSGRHAGKDRIRFAGSGPGVSSWRS